MTFHGSGGSMSCSGQSGLNRMLYGGFLQYGYSENIIMLFPQAAVNLYNTRCTWYADGYNSFASSEGFNVLGISQPYLQS